MIGLWPDVLARLQRPFLPAYVKLRMRERAGGQYQKGLGKYKGPLSIQSEGDPTLHLAEELADATLYAWWGWVSTGEWRWRLMFESLWRLWAAAEWLRES